MGLATLSPSFLFLGFCYLLYSLVRISGDGAMAREKKSEKREKRREEREGNVTPPPPRPPTLRWSWCGMYISLSNYSRQVHILPPITSLHHRLSSAALFWFPFPSKAPMYRKGRYNPKKGLQTIGKSHRSCTPPT